jgi:hypothetical protein
MELKQQIEDILYRKFHWYYPDQINEGVSEILKLVEENYVRKPIEKETRLPVDLCEDYGHGNCDCSGEFCEGNSFF